MGKAVNQNRKVIDGIPFPADWNDPQCLLWLYREAPTIQKNDGIYTHTDGEQFKYTGSGRYSHARLLAQIFFPKIFEWHNWAETVVKASCENDWLCITGCGTSGKTTGLALDDFFFWACSPLDTAVIEISSSLESANRRIWKETSRFYSAFSRAVGGYKWATMGTAPRPYISPYKQDEPTKRDQAHGIYISAMQKKADVEQEIEFIKGFHPRRIRVTVDELDSLREHGKAIVSVFIDNLSSGAREAQFRGLGNDPSLFNELGDLMQREKGKPLTMADTEWTSIHGVKCLRLDAWDSPNIRDKNKWTGLIRQEDIDRIVQRKGENSPSVWIQLHGLHPPEGSASTVLSEAMFSRFNCSKPVVWLHDFVSCAALDPAYGGDDCVIRQFDYGYDNESKLKIFFHPPEILKIDAGAVNSPVEYQVAEKAIAFCKARSILPINFVGDATGTTGGCMAILKREWSPRITEVEFGGLASERPVSEDNPTLAKDEYDRKVTELWFSFREFVEADMIRGLDRETASEFISREFEIRNRKTRLETKTDMKDRGLSSPDKADCTVCAIELLRQKGIGASIQTALKAQVSLGLEWEAKSHDFEESYEESYL